MMDMCPDSYAVEQRGPMLRLLLLRTIYAHQYHARYLGSDECERSERHGWCRAYMDVLAVCTGMTDEFCAVDLPAMVHRVRFIAPSPKSWWTELAGTYPELCVLITRGGKLIHPPEPYRPDATEHQAGTAA